jgi:hypothetical protein
METNTKIRPPFYPVMCRWSTAIRCLALLSSVASNWLDGGCDSEGCPAISDRGLNGASTGGRAIFWNDSIS